MGGSDAEKQSPKEPGRRGTFMVLAGRNKGKKSKRGGRSRTADAVKLKVSEQRLKVVLSVALVVILALLLVPYITLPPKTFNVGDVASRDIKAIEDFLVVEEASTLAKREEAVAKVLPVYDFDIKAIEEVGAKLARAFGTIKRAYIARAPEVALPPAVKPVGLLIPKQPPQGARGHAPDLAVIETSPLFAKKVDQFQKILGVPLTPEEIQALTARHFDPALQGAVLQVVAEVMRKGVVPNKPLLLQQGEQGIMIQEVGTPNTRVVTDFSDTIDIKALESAVREAAVRLPPEVTKDDRSVVTHLAASLIRPNLTFNKRGTEKRKSEAIAAVKPVLFQIKKGEMVIREGERVREEHLSKLKQLALHRNKRSTWNTVVGAHLLAALFLTLLVGGFYKFAPRTLTSTKDLLLISLVLVGNVLLIKAGIIFARAFAASFGTVPLTSYYYAIPYAIGAMLLVILLEKEVALVFSIMLTFFVGFMLQEGLSYPLVCLFSSLVAVLRANEYKRRSSILVTGLYIGGVNVVTIMTLALYSGAIFSVAGLFDVLMGFIGGLFAGVVVSVSLPVLEWLFNITSDIKLLELGDLNHPLLRQLVLRAPGTYHHSIIVSNLAEAAAEAIGANSLLVRVSSYYHDIGKIKKPEYFVENLVGESSKHEKLSPSMSSLVIASHVKEGIELARENKLPEKIIDVIPQHHGTGLISYFYDKAKKQEDPSLQEIKEGDYRYPGPKPQTKEAAIILLADSVEAAARTLTDPTPARIEGLVRKIVHNKFVDAQLDECDLTLKDLNVSIESFTRILMGMYHHRVDYPEGKEISEGVFAISEEGAVGSRRIESTVHRPNRRDDDTEESPPPLKRFGL